MKKKIENPRQLGHSIGLCSKQMRDDGWVITHKTFFDPASRRCDPIAALLYNEYLISKEIADIYYKGFLGKEPVGIPNRMIGFYNAGRISRRIFVVRNR